MANERLLAILPKDDTRVSGRCDREMGGKTICGRSSGWNLRRRLVKYGMHRSDDHCRTRYSSYRLARYAAAFDGMGYILPQTTFRDGHSQPALGDDASISWLHSIEQAIWPGDKMEW